MSEPLNCPRCHTFAEVVMVHLAHLDGVQVECRACDYAGPVISGLELMMSQLPPVEMFRIAWKYPA